MIFGVSYKYYWIDFKRDYDGKSLPNLMFIFLDVKIKSNYVNMYISIKLSREIMGKNLHCINSANSNSTTKVTLAVQCTLYIA